MSKDYPFPYRSAGLVAAGFVGDISKKYFPLMFNKKKMKPSFKSENEISTLGSSNLSFSTGNKSRKGMSIGTITYQDQWHTTTTCKGNQKLYSMVCSFGTRSQWLDEDNTTFNRDVLSYKRWFDLEPEAGTIGGPAQTAGTGLFRRATMALQSSQLYMDIANTSSLAVFCKVHIFVAKEDTDTSPLAYMEQQSVAQEVYNSTHVLPNTGSGFEGTQYGNPDPVYVARTSTVPEKLQTFPYSTLSSRMMNANWKKVKTHNLQLAGGDNHRLSLYGSINQLAMKDRLDVNTQIFPIGSVVVILEQQGTTAKARIVDGQNILGGFQLSSTTLTTVYTRKCHLTGLKDRSKRYKAAYIAGTVWTGNENPTTNTQLASANFAVAQGIVQT